MSSGQVAYDPDSKIIYHFGGHAIKTGISGPPKRYVYDDVYSLAYSPGNWQPWKEAGKLKVARNQGKVLFDIRSGYFWLLGGFNEEENRIERWEPKKEENLFMLKNIIMTEDNLELFLLKINSDCLIFIDSGFLTFLNVESALFWAQSTVTTVI